MDTFINYLKATAAEMKQVSWPTQAQAFSYTALVIAISAFVAAFAGAFDYLFSKGVEMLLLII